VSRWILPVRLCQEIESDDQVIVDVGIHPRQRELHARDALIVSLLK
jgi:hypothetical protein